MAAPETWLVEPSRGEPHTTRSRTVTWEAGAGTANLAWTRQLQRLPADAQQAAGSAAGSAAHGARAARRGVGAARVGGGVRGDGRGWSLRWSPRGGGRLGRDQGSGGGRGPWVSPADRRVWPSSSRTPTRGPHDRSPQSACLFVF